MDSLASKILVMIVGPTATGKSTLMNQVCAIDPRFKRVKSFTTRQPRANDEPDQYFYLTPESLDEHLGNGDVVTDVTLPGTNLHYGTLTESYPGDYNLLDTLAGSVPAYRNLPFYQTITVSLTCDPKDWTEWLNTRYPTPSEHRTKRLEEARMSVTWSLRQTENHYWLTNTPNDLETTAALLIEIATGKAAPSKVAPASATAMLDAIDGLLSLG